MTPKGPESIKGLCHMVVQQLTLVMGDVDLERWEAAHIAAKEVCNLSNAMETEIARLRIERNEAVAEESRRRLRKANGHGEGET